jgi:hypothetical protein
MHPNHLIALAHQHHSELLADADRRRFTRSNRRRNRSLRDLTLDGRRRRRETPTAIWGTSPPFTDLAT